MDISDSYSLKQIEEHRLEWLKSKTDELFEFSVIAKAVWKEIEYTDQEIIEASTKMFEHLFKFFTYLQLVSREKTLRKLMEDDSIKDQFTNEKNIFFESLVNHYEELSKAKRENIEDNSGE